MRVGECDCLGDAKLFGHQSRVGHAEVAARDAEQLRQRLHVNLCVVPDGEEEETRLLVAHDEVLDKDARALALDCLQPGLDLNAGGRPPPQALCGGCGIHGVSYRDAGARQRMTRTVIAASCSTMALGLMPSFSSALVTASTLVILALLSRPHCLRSAS